MGKERISGEVAVATKHIWWLTYAKGARREANKTVKKLEGIKG